MNVTSTGESRGRVVAQWLMPSVFTPMLATLIIVLASLQWACAESAQANDALGKESIAITLPSDRHRDRPQLATSGRLLHLGESITFAFWLPPGLDAGEVVVYPRYLEEAQPGDGFKPDGELTWLEPLPAERLTMPAGQGPELKTTYRPKVTGNYLIRWTVNGETLTRYFAVVDESYAVVRFGGYHELSLDTSLHGTGIPMDFPLPMDRCTSGDPLYERFCEYQRTFGDGVVPQLPDMPRSNDELRRTVYGPLLEKARQMLPDPQAARCARVEMWDDEDPGYARTLAELGVVSHFGLQMSNGGAWLGMPEFPYFASRVDIRKASQDPENQPRLVVHQWDFCGGWHFLGPTSWHWSISNHDFAPVEKCVNRGVAEAVLAAENSGHPVCIFPLYDGNLELTDANRAFVEKFQRLVAFELTKKQPLVYARAIDIADYYRRRQPVTPRTLFLSKTDGDEIFYVMHWHNLWAGRHELMARERLPWLTRLSSIFEMRKRFYGAKDPWSYEYLVVEDQRRSLRFERESPNPLWWFDYTNPENHVTPKGSEIEWSNTPDVDWLAVVAGEADGVGNPPTLPQWKQKSDGWHLRLKAVTDQEWPDYGIVLWGLPTAYAERPDVRRIRTSAKTFQVAKSPAGEYHLYLEFDLKPNQLVDVTIGN